MIVTRKVVNPNLFQAEYAWEQLDNGAQYRVIEIEYDYFRIQTNKPDWKPCLYHANLFDILDARVEPEWVVDLQIIEDGELELCIGFPEFLTPGFWEDVHDDQSDAQRILIPIFDRLGLVHSE